MALLLDDLVTPDHPVYDGTLDELEADPMPHPVVKQVARGLLYAGAGLLVGWLVFHWLAGQTAGWIA